MEGPLMCALAAILFASAFFTRKAASALAGAFPLCFGIFLYLDYFTDGIPAYQHFAVAVGMILIIESTAFVFFKKTRDAQSFVMLGVFEWLLHVSAAFVLYGLFRTQLPTDGLFFASTLAAFAVAALASRFPMRALMPSSSVPFLLALYYILKHDELFASTPLGHPLLWIG
ncbi:MAG: hypothetical protein ACK5LK_03430, partial [Chthoniobacterales bacterium]